MNCSHCGCDKQKYLDEIEQLETRVKALLACYKVKTEEIDRLHDRNVLLADIVLAAAEFLRQRENGKDANYELEVLDERLHNLLEGEDE